MFVCLCFILWIIALVVSITCIDRTTSSNNFFFFSNTLFYCNKVTKRSTILILFRSRRNVVLSNSTYYKEKHIARIRHSARRVHDQINRSYVWLNLMIGTFFVHPSVHITRWSILNTSDMWYLVVSDNLFSKLFFFQRLLYYRRWILYIF